MVRKNLAVLFVVSLMVAASAVTSADAGVGGCRVAAWCGGGGGYEAVQAPSRGRTDDVLSALSFVLPRPVVEGLRAFLTTPGGEKDRGPAPTTPSASIEGVGGCRTVWCGGGGGWQ